MANNMKHIDIGFPVFVMHYSPLEERRLLLEKQLFDNGISATWVTMFDAENLSTDILEEWYRNDPEVWRNRGAWQNSGVSRPLRLAEVSLAIKHLVTMQKLVDQDLRLALFLEDDVIFERNFVQKLLYRLKSFPKDGDLAFIGSGCDLRVEKRQLWRHWYRRTDPVSRCTDSFLISSRAAAAILRLCKPFSLPIDFEINFAARQSQISSYWLEPPLVRQGSQSGVFKSVVQEGGNE